MKNAKAFVLVSLLSVAGLAKADECCQAVAEVPADVASTEVVVTVDAAAEQAKAKKLAADLANATQEVTVEVKG